MSQYPIRKSLASILALVVFLTSLPSLALADLIGTRTMLELQARQERQEQIEQFLSRDEVQQQLITLGVDPADARQRVAALTDSELQQLAQRIDTLPAGGNVIAVLGILFVVLLVLDLLGVTNVFTRL